MTTNQETEMHGHDPDDENKATEPRDFISHAVNPVVMSYAQDFYASYCASSDGKNFQGNPCPKWGDLPSAVRGHWYVVALRAFALHKALSGVEPVGVPTEYEFGHLADPSKAKLTWGDYVSGKEPG